jgi:hypothetical protein
MDEQWQIEPLVGFGPLRLGMNRSEVQTLEPILGELYAYDQVVLPSGEIRYNESRDLEAPIVTFRDNIVVEISIDHHSKFSPSFQNISAFEDPAQEFLTTLEKANGSALIGLGLVLFDKLAINTNGFFIQKPGLSGSYWEQLNDRSIQRVITLSKPNNYEPFLKNYSEISFLK